MMRSYFTHVASLAPTTTKWLRWLLCMTTTLSLSLCDFVGAKGFEYKGALSLSRVFSMTDFEREAKKKKKTKTKEGTDS